MTLVTRPAMTDDDGTFTTGTEVDEALIDLLLDEVDDQVHSATNTTIKPKAIVDEVVTARGSEATLDARLSVSLEDDGTLKTQASLVTVAQVQSALGSRNIALNGDLDVWTAGDTSAPDSFTLAGAAATIVKTGIGEADTTHFGTGSGFAAKITRAGTNWTLTQDVIAAADFAKHTNVESQKVSAAIKGKTGIASYLRLVIDDGVTTTASDYHTGGDTEEHLDVTHTISNSATELSVYVEGTASDGDAYVGGLMVVFSDLAPSDWSALSAVNDASSTQRGLVSIGTQTIAGAKTLSSLLTASAGLALPTGSILDFAYARCTSALTKNANITPEDITGLAFAVGANETWVFLFVMKGISTAVADWRFALTGPGSPTAVWSGIVLNMDSPAAGAVAAFAADMLAGGSGVEDAVLIVGLLRNGANAGTVQAQMAQSNSEASASIIRAESFVIAIRVA